MEHFAEQVWTDFVRGVPLQHAKTEHSEEAKCRTELESHLAAGCNDCAVTLDFWKQVYGIATRESGYCPPENLVHMAKVGFAVSRRQSAAETTEARLVFDTFSQPILAGVRSPAAAARQMVYQAEGLTVDVRFDRQPNSNRVQLTGQVLDGERSQAVLSNFPVTLCTVKGLLLAKCRTNYFGEFHLEFEAQDDLRLTIWVAGNKLIRITLANWQQKTDLDRTGNRPHGGNR